jgi:hypothetical protein
MALPREYLAVAADPDMDVGTRQMILAMLEADSVAAAGPPQGAAGPGLQVLARPGFLEYNPLQHGSIDDFLDDFKPTKITIKECDWISVKSPNRLPTPQDPIVFTDCIAIRDGEGSATVRSKKILQRASEGRQTTGK